MPVFNGGAQLAVSVQSIRQQTLRNWKLLILDDGSTDDAVEAVRALGDARIKIVSDGKNLGLARRLNQVIDQTESPFIARMDHDDIAHPTRLARQLAFLQAHPQVSLVGSRCLSISETQAIVGQLPFAETHENICARPWLGFSLAHPSWLGRTEWFKSHRYADPAPYCCEDQELLLRGYQDSRYHALPEPLLAYSVRTRTPFMKLFRTRAALAAAQIEFFVSQGRVRDALLASCAFGIRISADVLRQVAPRFRSDVRSLEGQMSPEWTSVLDEWTSILEKVTTPR